jgi:hypothetical protein
LYKLLKPVQLAVVKTSALIYLQLCKLEQCTAFSCPNIGPDLLAVV